jgi:hypothetical protein
MKQCACSEMIFEMEMVKNATKGVAQESRKHLLEAVIAYSYHESFFKSYIIISYV